MTTMMDDGYDNDDDDLQSYGGFVVSHVLGSKEDTNFRCGIAVAPVTDWRYYGL